MQRDYILLDRSGSMASTWDESIGAINGYVKDLVDKGVETLVTLVAFDSQSIEPLREDVAPSEWVDVSDKDAMPRGMTPLNDAVGKVVTKGLEANAEKTALIVVTDGLENASHEYSHAQAKALLDKVKDKGWGVLFIGADFDNAQQASDYGIVDTASAYVVKGKMGEAFTAASMSRSAYGSGIAVSMNYTDAQKKSLATPDEPENRS